MGHRMSEKVRLAVLATLSKAVGVPGIAHTTFVVRREFVQGAGGEFGAVQLASSVHASRGKPIGRLGTNRISCTAPNDVSS